MAQNNREKSSLADAIENLSSGRVPLEKVTCVSELKGYSWDEIEVDHSLPPLLETITYHPWDVASSQDHKWYVRQRFVWVLRPQHQPADRRMPSPKDPLQQPLAFVDITPSHQSCVSLLRIHHLPKHISKDEPLTYHGLYLEWSFDVPLKGEPEPWVAFFRAIHLAPSFLRKLEIYHKGPSRRVFVEAWNGQFFGRLLHQLATAGRQHRAKALLIQMYGKVNGAPCQCCEKRYRRTFTQVGSSKVHVNFPFFDCVSPAGWLAGILGHDAACGNCIFHQEHCSWRKVAEESRVRTYVGWHLFGPLGSFKGALDGVPVGRQVIFDGNAAYKAQWEEWERGLRRQLYPRSVKEN